MATTRVEYKTIDGTLKNSVVQSGTNIDWSTAAIFTRTLTGNTTFTFSNLEVNKTITLVVTGNFVLGLPAYTKRIGGIYDGTVINYIQLHCVNATGGSESVWYSIAQEL